MHRRTLVLLALLVAIAFPAAAHNRTPLGDLSSPTSPAIAWNEPLGEITVDELPVVDAATIAAFDDIARMDVDLPADPLANLNADVEAILRADANAPLAIVSGLENRCSGFAVSLVGPNVRQTNELSLKLHWGHDHVRNRWFDPSTGTWLTPDPLGYQDSSNLYAFAGGDPVNRRDPTGTNSASDAGSGECELVLVVNHSPFKPYLQDCEGNQIPLPDDEPVVDCSQGCIGAAVPVVEADRSLPYTKYGRAGDKAVGTVQFVGNVLNGFDNAVRRVYQGPGSEIPSYFEPQSYVQERTQETLDTAATLYASYAMVAGGVRIVRGRTLTRTPIKEPVVEAEFEYNGKIYYDTNPTARNPVYRTGERLPGLSAANRTTSLADAEIGAMDQALRSGKTGGTGILRTSNKPICGFCKGDIKTMARKLGLQRLKVIDYETGKWYEFVGDEMLPIKKGGKGWK